MYKSSNGKDYVPYKTALGVGEFCDMNVDGLIAGQPVTVSAKIVNMTTGSTYTPTSASWTMDVMDKENWKSLKHSTTNSISVTTTETDRNGTQYDVDVLAECHFN